MKGESKKYTVTLREAEVTLGSPPKTIVLYFARCDEDKNALGIGPTREDSLKDLRQEIEKGRGIEKDPDMNLEPDIDPVMDFYLRGEAEKTNRFQGDLLEKLAKFTGRTQAVEITV